MIKKLIHELVADLATPAAMRAVPTLLELAEFDEFASDATELEEMISRMDALYDDNDYHFELWTSSRRNYILNEIIFSTNVLRNRLDKIKSDTRGQYLPCGEVIDGPGLYHFVTVSKVITQTLIAEDSVFAAITFGS